MAMNLVTGELWVWQEIRLADMFNTLLWEVDARLIPNERYSVPRDGCSNNELKKSKKGWLTFCQKVVV